MELMMANFVEFCRSCSRPGISKRFRLAREFLGTLVALRQQRPAAEASTGTAKSLQTYLEQLE